MKVIKSLYQSLLDRFNFTYPGMETSYKKFHQETQNKLFSFITSSFALMSIFSLPTLFIKSNSLSGILVRSLGLLFSLVAYFIRQKYPIVQKILVLCVFVVWIQHLLENLATYVGETGLDLSFEIGNIIGLLEMMMALSAKDLKLRYFVLMGIIVGKLLGFANRITNEPVHFAIVIIAMLIAVVFCIFNDKLDRRNFKNIFESGEKLKKFQSLLSYDLPSSVIIITANLNSILYSNNFFKDSFGNTQEMSKTILEKFVLEREAGKEKGPEQETSLFNFLQQLSKERQELLEKEVIILYATHKDMGSNSKHYEIKIRKIIWENDLSYAIVLNDVSDKQMVVALKIADEHKDRVIATVSHELRTPINGIMGLLDMAKSKIIDKESVTFIDHCKSCSKLLLYLVNSILDLSQLRNKKLKITKDYFSLKEFLEEVSSLYLFQSQQKGLEFIIKVDARVPEKIYTDKYRLIEILLNLLGNSIKFTFKGFIKLTISVDEIDFRKLLFEVEDTGIGIKEEDKDKLFQMFGKVAQLDKNINQHGSGLGLTIANELVKILNNDQQERIEFESTYNRGSAFWFKVNISNEYDCSVDHVTESEKLLENITDSMRIGEHELEETSPIFKLLELYHSEKYEKNRLKTKTKSDNEQQGFVSLGASDSQNTSEQLQNLNKEVLIVDDNSFNLLAASFAVQKLGFNPTKAFNGEEAIKILEEDLKNNKKYCFILTDIQMPVLDGIQMSKAIHKKINEGELYDLPIIALTAKKLDKKERKMYQESGISYALEKPLVSDSLKKILNSLIQDKLIEDI